MAVRVCPSVSVSTYRTSVAVHQYTYQHVGPWTQHADPSRGLFDVRGCLCVFVCVRLCPSAHKGRPWLSISTHISTSVFGFSTLALPMDCLGDFGPRGLSVQYTQDVCGCPPAHTGRLWLSVSKHRTSVAVSVCSWVSASTHRTSVDVHDCPSAHTGRPCVSVSTHRTSVCVHQHTQDVRVCPCVFMCVRQHTQDVRGCPSVHISAHWTSVGVRQHTQDVRGCPSAHTGRPWLSVCVRVCPSAHTERLWLSISTHINTLVLGLSTLTLPVDCSGDFAPRGLSVQYTQDVRVCPSAHTGRPCVSVSTHRTSVAVHQYTYQHVGPWTQHDDLSRGLSGRLWLFVVFVSTHMTSVAVPVCLCVSVSTHMTSVAVHQYTYQHAGPWTQHAGPSRGLFGLGDFGPQKLSVQYRQDVRGCPSDTQDVHVCSSAHTGRPWLFVCVRVCPSAHKGRLWLSINTHISTLVLGLSTLTLPVDCLGDFGPHGLSAQYTQDVCGCPPAHTGRLWLSVCVRVCPSVSVSTHRMSVAVHQTYVGVRQHTQDVCGCPLADRTSVAVSMCLWVSASTHRTSVGVHGCPSAHTGCLCVSVSTHRTSVCVRVCSCVSVSTHRTSVAVHQYTYRHAAVRVCPWVSASTHMTAVDVHGYPSAHIGRPCVSVSTHRTSVAVRVCPCVSVSTHRTSYTQDVRGCPSAHTGHPCVSVSTHMTSVAVRVCPCVSVSTHRTSVAVHQYTYQHVGPWTQHADPSRGLSGDFGPRGLSVQYTQDVCGTHISTLVLGLSTLALPVDCSGDFGPCGLSFQYTQVVRGCPPAHTGRLWLSVCVRLCPSARTGRPLLSISTHISTLVLSLSTLALLMDCLGDFGPRGLSVQYTQDVRGCPSAHTGRPCVSVTTHRTSVAVRVCPSEHKGRQWLSISTHISTLVLGLSTMTLPVDCSGDFVPHGLSVQYTQNVRGCPPAHTGRSWLSVFVRVCPSVSVSTHRMSVAVHQYTYQHVGLWIQHAGPSRGLFG
ncbi:hypothetical protein YC2023_108716 [Brassica napus]